MGGMALVRAAIVQSESLCRPVVQLAGLSLPGTFLGRTLYPLQRVSPAVHAPPVKMGSRVEGIRATDELQRHHGIR